MGEEDSTLRIGVDDHLPTGTTRWGVTFSPNRYLLDSHIGPIDQGRGVDGGLFSMKDPSKALVLNIPSKMDLRSTINAESGTDHNARELRLSFLCRLFGLVNELGVPA